MRRTTKLAIPSIQPRRSGKHSMLLKKEQLIKDVTYTLTHLSSSAKLLGKLGYLDLNVAAEDFYKDLLNISYGLRLDNLNTSQQNSPAIDLGDKAAKVAFQVTSQNDARKIQKCLNSFSAHGLGTEYTSIKVLIIGSRTGKYPSVKTPDGVIFSACDDIIDNFDLLNHLRKKSTSDLEKIADLMRNEVYPSSAVQRIERMTDQEALVEIRAAMNRSALQDPWDREYNYQAFGEAITDLIELLSTGNLNGLALTKRRADFSDTQLRDGLETIYGQLRSLRGLFTAHRNSGEIDIALNTCNFVSPQSSIALDSARNAINHGFSVMTAPYGIQALPKVS